MVAENPYLPEDYRQLVEALGMPPDERAVSDSLLLRLAAVVAELGLKPELWFTPDELSRLFILAPVIDLGQPNDPAAADVWAVIDAADAAAGVTL